MKKLLAIVSVLFLFSCSQSNEDKAKKLVKEYLQKNLNDPKSYEAVEWGKLDSSFLEFDEVSRIEFAEIERAGKDAVDYLSQSDLVNGEIQKRKYDSLKIIYEEKKKNYKPTFNSFFITHKYRAKNALGAVILSDSKFYIADDFSKVINQGK